MSLNTCPQAVTLPGSHNSWAEWADPMSDPDGDGIFEVEIEVDGGTTMEFKFLADASWSSEMGPPPHSSCDFDPNDTFYNFGLAVPTGGTDSLELIFCPGYCSCDDVVARERDAGICSSSDDTNTISGAPRMFGVSVSVFLVAFGATVALY